MDEMFDTGHIAVRCATPHDLKDLASMFHALWPDSTTEEHARELTVLLLGRPSGIFPTAVFVGQIGDRLIGFVQVGLRSHADGCDTAHAVGYLEGWYVDPAYRRRKVGAQLVAAAEQWARDHGCVEIASDTWITSLDSQKAHEALGFEVVDRCVNYRKRL